MKLDTSEDRLEAVKRLYARATKISDAFRRKSNRVSFGDVFGLMALMEKLNALEELIRTESFWEQAIQEIYDVEDVEEDTREKFVAATASNAYVFLKVILVTRVETLRNFTDNEYESRRLLEFQKEVYELMTALREVYEDIYGV